MPSARFLDRSARILWARVVSQRREERRWLKRLTGIMGGLALAALSYFALKGAALAAGAALPGGEGLALWLAGADPLTSALGAALQPVFAGRI